MNATMLHTIGLNLALVAHYGIILSYVDLVEFSLFNEFVKLYCVMGFGLGFIDT